MPYDATTGIYTYDGTEAASPYKTMLNLLGNSVKTAITNLAASFSDTQQGAAQWAYNSCFDVWQRGTGDFTTTGWTADRWNMISRTATTVRRNVLPATDTFFQSVNAMQIQATATTNSAKIVQPFPSEDVAEMRGKTVVFEVYAQALTTGTTQLTVAIEKSATANVATSGTWSVVNSTTATVTQAGTKVLVTTTIPADASAAGVRISVSTNNVPNSGGMNIGRITFKPGTTGPANHQRRGRTSEGETISCARFYLTYDFTNTSPSGPIIPAVQWGSTAGPIGSIHFPQPMRTTPVLTASRTAARWVGAGTTAAVNLVTATSPIWPYGTDLSFSNAGSFTAAGWIDAFATLAFSAELP